MKKRFLSLLLVLVLIMSLMPTALAVNADDAQPKTISVTFRLHTDTDEWIAPTEVSDLPEGTSVFTVFQKVLADKGYTYEYHEQYCADVGMNDFVLMDGDEIEVLYTADYKKEPGMSLPYTDVSWDHWAYTAIKRMYTRGLMVGVNETTFAPSQELSRAMLSVILYARAGQPAVEAANPFTDVPADSWYTDAVVWAADNGIVSGFGDGTFRPNDALTRAQAAVMLCAFAAFTQDDVTVRADLSAYSDAGQIPSWAMDAMQWANARQLIIGRDSAHLAPAAATTRAEMASILSAYIRK